LKIILDTNVVLDVLLEHNPFAGPAAEIFSLAERSEIDGFLCATTLQPNEKKWSDSIPADLSLSLP
jgi:predicted nucleic acid-binding protein